MKVNHGLNRTDFKAGPGRFSWSMRPSDLNGFLGTPTVVTLRGGFKLYKLTGDKAPDGQWNITPWWSTVVPYLEDREGARGRYEQAALNGIDMSSMARFMSAVVIDWNSLAEYVEVTIKPGVEICCFWGKFAPMRLSQATTPEKARADLKLIQERSTTTSEGFSDAVLPPDIGVLTAWQFYVPGLKNEHLAGGSTRTIIDAHDMQALGAHLGVPASAPSIRRLPRTPSPEAFFKATTFSLVQARNPWLREMDAILAEIDATDPPPRPLNPRSPAILALLERFAAAGERYQASSRDPRKVKSTVGEYILLARSWLP